MIKNIMYIDGGSRGNPGPSGCGVMLINNKKKYNNYYYIDNATCNQAEYLALIKGLILAKELKINYINVYSDSELLCKQINGLYKVKNENIKKLFFQANDLILNFKKFIISYIPREQNKEADRLVNIAIDRKMDGKMFV